MHAGQALMAGARRSDRVASHGGPRRRGLRGAPSLLMRCHVPRCRPFNRSAPSHDTSDSLGTE